MAGRNGPEGFAVYGEKQLMESNMEFDNDAVGEGLEEKSDDFDREADVAEFVRLALMEKPGLRAWKFNREELYEERS